MSSTSSSACEWCTIESDPGVMTELLEELGVVGVELQELCSLDDESLASCGTVLGFLFLFQWLPTTSTTSSTTSSTTTIPEGLFFAHQTVTNACATQALLSIVMNSPTIDKGQRLTDFQTFTASFPPTLLGDAIGASTDIHQVHNSFARQDKFWLDGLHLQPTNTLHNNNNTTIDKENIYHFIAYVPHQGNVYELDGLQPGPILLGKVTDSMDWKPLAITAMQHRMTATPNNVHYNLMALVHLDPNHSTTTTTTATATMDSNTIEQHANQRLQWKRENQRRKHNYIPLCLQLLRELAQQGTLETRVQEAYNTKSTK